MALVIVRSREVAGAATLLLAACSHGWDEFDPRLGASQAASSSSASAGGAGSGGAAASSGTGGTAGVGAAGGGGAGGGSPDRILWSKSFGDAGVFQRGHRVATDAAGNVYVTGVFDGEIDFGGGALLSAGGTDVFLAKLDADGGHVWSQRFGGTDDDGANGLAVTTQDYVAVTGWFQGTIDFGEGPLTSAGDEDGFLATFDSAGAPLCSARFGGAGLQMGADLSPEDDGDFDIVGMFFGDMTLGPASFVNGGGRDVFFGRVSGGNCVPFAAKSFPGAGHDYGWSIASISGSQTVLGMDSDGSLDLGGGLLANAGGDDVFLPRLLGSGGHVWSRRFGDATTQWAPHVAIGAADSVLGAGSFDGTFDVGAAAAPVTTSGDMDIYVFKLDGDGDGVWVRGFGDPLTQRAEEIDVDAAGRVLVTGRVQGTVDFGGGPFAPGGLYDVFALVLTPDGEHAWSLVAGDAGVQEGWGIAADLSGSVVVTGDFEGTLDLGAGPMTSQGGLDVFVAKFAP